MTIFLAQQIKFKMDTCSKHPWLNWVQECSGLLYNWDQEGVQLLCVSKLSYWWQFRMKGDKRFGECVVIRVNSAVCRRTTEAMQTALTLLHGHSHLMPWWFAETGIRCDTWSPPSAGNALSNVHSLWFYVALRGITPCVASGCHSQAADRTHLSLSSSLFKTFSTKAHHIKTMTPSQSDRKANCSP